MNKKDIRDNIILAVVMLLLMIGACKAALRGGIAYDVLKAEIAAKQK